jgi:hypothetical protein
MNPLSVTASIIAVQQVTGSVVSAVYNYRKGVKNAPENVAKVVEELTGLFHAIENFLQTIGKERRLTGATRLASLEDLVRPEGSLEFC